MKRSIALVLILLMALSVGCIFGDDKKKDDSPNLNTKPVEQVAQELFAKMNEERTSMDLPALAWDDTLASYAKKQSDALAFSNAWWFDGEVERKAAIEAVISISKYSEDGAGLLDVHNTDLVERAFDNFSGDHFFTGDYNKIGIGVSKRPDNYYKFFYIIVKTR